MAPSIQERPFSKQDWHCDDFGSRGPSFRKHVSGNVLLRGTTVNRIYGTDKNLYIYLFLLLIIIFGPIHYGPPQYLFRRTRLSPEFFRDLFFRLLSGDFSPALQGSSVIVGPFQVSYHGKSLRHPSIMLLYSDFQRLSGLLRNFQVSSDFSGHVGKFQVPSAHIISAGLLLKAFQVSRGLFVSSQVSSGTLGFLRRKKTGLFQGFLASWSDFQISPGGLQPSSGFFRSLHRPLQHISGLFGK